MRISCSECGGIPEMCGRGDEEGPWYVRCTKCGRESQAWVYKREAWNQWKADNKKEVR